MKKNRSHAWCLFETSVYIQIYWQNSWNPIVAGFHHYHHYHTTHKVWENEIPVLHVSIMPMLYICKKVMQQQYGVVTPAFKKAKCTNKSRASWSWWWSSKYFVQSGKSRTDRRLCWKRESFCCSFSRSSRIVWECKMFAKYTWGFPPYIFYYFLSYLKMQRVAIEISNDDVDDDRYANRKSNAYLQQNSIQSYYHRFKNRVV